MSRRRFKRGDIVKQRRHGTVFDFFHVEVVHTHEDGSQGLDAIGDRDGVLYGLDGDFSRLATLLELVEDRERRA